MKALFVYIKCFLLIVSAGLASCDNQEEPSIQEEQQRLSEEEQPVVTEAGNGTDTVQINPDLAQADFNPISLLAFARTQIGVPYLYASTDPAMGFDCSGFITYVFNHFGMKVPRSSVDFTNYGKEVDTTAAAPGDLILFTGTDSSSRVVGHMGIVESIQDGTIYFIHSTSGKAKGVVITPMGEYYRKRFVKIIRVFSDRYFE